jgi:hypothetical protein
MRIIITESQYRLLNELSPSSTGVEEFLEMVKSTKGMLKELGFKTLKSLEEYITDGGFKEFDELRKDAEKYNKKIKKTEK